MRFVNIKPGAAEAVYVDAETVTCIKVLPKDNEIVFYGENGIMSHFGKAQAIDPAVALQSLEQAGFPFSSLPIRDQGQEVPCFIAPGAVTFITVSEPDKAGAIGVIVGATGDRIETYAATPQELAGLLAAIKKAGKDFFEYEPHQAYSRWSRPAKLYIDPLSITRLQEDSAETLHTYFKGGDRLDIKVHSQRLREEYLWEEEDIANRMHAADPKRDIRRCFNDARRLVKEKGKAIRKVFAGTLAAANGTLTEIPGGEGILYVKPEEISDLQSYDNVRAGAFSLVVSLKKKSPRDYNDSWCIDFNTRAARDRALMLFEGMGKKMLPPPAPGP